MLSIEASNSSNMKQINAYEQTGATSYENIFIAALALYQINITNYLSGVEKGVFDINFLREAEKNLMKANEIALCQFQKFGSVDFRSWMRNERWVHGGMPLLASYYDKLSLAHDNDRIKSYYENWCNIIDSLETSSMAQSSTGTNHVEFAGQFNDLNQLAKRYSKVLIESNDRLTAVERKEKLLKEDLLFYNLFSRVRSVVQSICDDSFPPELFLMYSRGTFGDILAAHIMTVLERERHFIPNDILDDHMAKEIERQQFIQKWNGDYKLKLELCRMYAKELGRLIQNSIAMFIFYDKCSIIERIIANMIDSGNSLLSQAAASSRIAAENIAAVAQQSVQWEFLKAGVMLGWSPVLMPVCLLIDFCQGNQEDTSWAHKMKSQIVDAGSKSLTTLLLVAGCTVVSTVFLGLATAASFGTVPAVAAALMLTHSSIAISSGLLLAGAVTVGSYSWQRKEQLKIENQKKAELDAIDLVGHCQKLEMFKLKLDEETKSAVDLTLAVNSIARTQDEIARYELQEREIERRAEAEKRRRKEAFLSGHACAPHSTDSRSSSSSDHFSPEDIRREMNAAIASMSPEEARVAASEIGDVHEALAEHLTRLQDELRRLETGAVDSELANLRERSRCFNL